MVAPNKDVSSVQDPLSRQLMWFKSRMVVYSKITVFLIIKELFCIFEHYQTPNNCNCFLSCYSPFCNLISLLKGYNYLSSITFFIGFYFCCCYGCCYSFCEPDAEFVVNFMVIDKFVKWHLFLSLEDQQSLQV